MAAASGLVPVADVEEALLCPPSRGALQLLGEDRAACRNVDPGGAGAGDQLVHSPDALPVQAGGGGAGAGQPVEHQVVEELVAGEHVLWMAVAVRPGIGLLDDPGAERRR